VYTWRGFHNKLYIPPVLESVNVDDKEAGHVLNPDVDNSIRRRSGYLLLEHLRCNSYISNKASEEVALVGVHDT
jgi:hypothetical protein